jgi:hypothetical protein
MGFLGRKGNVGATITIGYMPVNAPFVGGTLYLYGSALVSKTLTPYDSENLTLVTLRKSQLTPLRFDSTSRFGLTILPLTNGLVVCGNVEAKAPNRAYRSKGEIKVLGSAFVASSIWTYKPDGFLTISGSSNIQSSNFHWFGSGYISVGGSIDKVTAISHMSFNVKMIIGVTGSANATILTKNYQHIVVNSYIELLGKAIFASDTWYWPHEETTSEFGIGGSARIV